MCVCECVCMYYVQIRDVCMRYEMRDPKRVQQCVLVLGAVAVLLFLVHYGSEYQRARNPLLRKCDGPRPKALLHAQGGSHYEVASAAACALYDSGFSVTVLVSFGLVVRFLRLALNVCCSRISFLNFTQFAGMDFTKRLAASTELYGHCAHSMMNVDRQWEIQAAVDMHPDLTGAKPLFC
jgi:hypothetical protein